jgi:hypothetical protein
MRTVLLVIAAIGFSALSSPGYAVPAQKGKFVGRLGECVRLANARGWTRYRERGRYRFIVNCRRGRIV